MFDISPMLSQPFSTFASVKNAKPSNLRQLFDMMKNMDPEVLDRGGRDYKTNLPTFGGAEPRDTSSVWSWDNNNLIVGEYSGNLKIVSRKEWES